MRSRYSDSLRTGKCGDRIPVEDRLFALVQTDSVLESGHTHKECRLISWGKETGKSSQTPTSSSAEFNDRLELH